MNQEEFEKTKLKKYLTPYKYGKPVLTGSGTPGAFDEQAVDIPFVFWHKDRFYMMYTGFDGIGYQSALATSTDLLHWKHEAVILKRNLDSDRWDAVGGAVTWMLKEDNDLFRVPKLGKYQGKYWLAYHSYPGKGYEEGPAEIGLAWSEDEKLLDWHFLDQPIFSWRDGEKWERGGLYKSCIIRHEDRFYMFYNAKNEGEGWHEQTGLAISDDLFHFKRYATNPVVANSASGFDKRFTSDPNIVRDGQIWLDFFFGLGGLLEDGHSHAMEGLAFSEDLIHWTKLDRPILTYGASGEIDATHAHKPALVYYNDTLYHFYCATRPYQDGDKTNALGEFRTITVAASKPF